MKWVFKFSIIYLYMLMAKSENSKKLEAKRFLFTGECGLALWSRIVKENLKGHTADACINGKKKLLHSIRKGDSISGFSNFKSYS